MSRIRSIKPEFFFDEELAELPCQTRLFFIGLWNQADRRGRLEDRPSKLKAQILPYEKADPDQLLNSLQPKFLVRYEVEGKKYLWIRAFEKHQRPHHTEAESCIPEFKGELPVTQPLEHGENPPVLKEEGKEVGKEKGKGKGMEVEAPLTPQGANGFDAFWSRYPKQEGYGKAQEAWNKYAKHVPLETILAGIGRWELSQKWADGYVPMPATWLNQRRWKDNPKPGRKEFVTAQEIWDQAQEGKANG